MSPQELVGATVISVSGNSGYSCIEINLLLKTGAKATLWAGDEEMFCALDSNQLPDSRDPNNLEQPSALKVVENRTTCGAYEKPF